MSLIGNWASKLRLDGRARNIGNGKPAEPPATASNRVILFKFSPIRLKWFACIEGQSSHGIGETRQDALADLVMACPDDFGICEFRTLVLTPGLEK